MARFVARRLFLQTFVLLGLSVLTFVLMFLVPGDPAASVVVWSAGGVSQEAYQAFREMWGLDKPLHEQYLHYMGNLLRGDLGKSMVSNGLIAKDLSVFFPATVELAVVSTFFALLVGIPAGIAAALRRNSLVDHVTRVISLVGVSMPIFWLAVMGIYFFFFKWGLLPSSQRIAISLTPPPTVTGLYTVDALLDGDLVAFKSALNHLIMPSAVLALSAVALIARVTRSSMLEVLRQDYIRTAHAKGLRPRAVVLRHALRNALIPTTTATGLMIGGLLSGAVLTETIFAWPGIGRYAVNAIFYMDRPAVMGVTLLIGVVYSLVNLTVDILVASLDPRIEY
ncbi:MAG: ABC transporter permease [Anaerolineae bacterium]|nr:ABC transporter permease [Anaerolineae bacterium]